MKDDAKRIALLRGDPKKSVMQIALPVMVTMIFTSLYNVIDGIWIAGLGNSALAGIGIVTPLWMIINGVSNGLAHGATSTISRYAANDKEKAQKAAEHAIMVSLTGALLLTGLLTGALFPYLTLYDIESDTRHEAICYSSLPVWCSTPCSTLCSSTCWAGVRPVLPYRPSSPPC